MAEPRIIALGGREFALRPLTLGQLRRLLDAVDGLSGKTAGALIDAAVEVLCAGLPAAELSADEILALEGVGVEEVNAAVAAVLENAGLRPLAAGEAAPQPAV